MNRYLVIQGARFGDLLQTSRLIKTLNALGEVELVTDSKLVELAKLIYPGIKGWGLKMHGKLDCGEMQHNEKIFGELKKENYSRIINCNFSSLTGCVARLFPSDSIIGYRPSYNSQGGFQLSPWLKFVFRITSKRVINPMNLVDIWGWFWNKPVSAYIINPAASRKGNILGVAVSGTIEQRSLPVKVLSKIINIYYNIYHPSHIKLFGSSQETQKARKLMRELSAPAVAKTINLCGKTDWPALYKEMEGIGMLITPDTGLMHLAAFLGIPVMAFFLSSALCHETGPYGEGHIIWQALPECAPCLENHTCRNNLKCASMFDTPEFYRALSNYLTDKSVGSLPLGMQLWRTGFDELGQKLLLVAGSDGEGEQRKIVRDYAKEFLGLNYNLIADSLEKKKMLETLAPDTDWMLPPWRYGA